MGIIEKKSNSQAIADYILSRILDGTLRSGDKLDTERCLSEQLGVSRVSVREALSGLIVLGILEARQGAGTLCGRAEQCHDRAGALCQCCAAQPRHHG